jgi:hypothetical protein
MSKKPPRAVLGAVLGDILARICGANPRVGRQLGAFAADPEIQAKAAAAVSAVARRVNRGPHHS